MIKLEDSEPRAQWPAAWAVPGSVGRPVAGLARRRVGGAGRAAGTASAKAGESDLTYLGESSYTLDKAPVGLAGPAFNAQKPFDCCMAVADMPSCSHRGRMQSVTAFFVWGATL